MRKSQIIILKLQQLQIAIIFQAHSNRGGVLWYGIVYRNEMWENGVTNSALKIFLHIPSLGVIDLDSFSVGE